MSQLVYYMTVREVADTLKVSDKHIRTIIKRLYPEKLRNGIKTWLDEEQVTAIKLEIEKNPYLDQLVEVKTGLEKKLIIAQAMQYLNEEIEELRSQNSLMKPKAELADKALRDESKHYSIRDAGKHLGLRQSEIFAIMRNNGLLTTKDLPSQKAIDYEILTLRTNSKTGRNFPQAVMTMQNIDNFRKRYMEDK